jgi:hypothetical protein
VGNFTPWGYSVSIGTSNSTYSYHYQFDAATKPYLFTQVTSGYTANEINWIKMTSTLDFTAGLAPHVLDYIELRSNYSAQGESYFHYPTCIASDPSGNIYVGAWDDGCIWKFDSSGTLLVSIGSKGTGDGQFQHITGIAVNNSGYIYTMDTSRKMIQVFTPGGIYIHYADFEDEFQAVNGQEFLGICLDSSSNVYIVMHGDSGWATKARVMKFSPTGVYLAWTGEDYNNNYYYGIAANSSDYIYVGDRTTNKIRIYTNALVYKRQFTAYYPMGIEFDTSNRLYVVSNNFIDTSLFTVFNCWGKQIGGGGIELVSAYDVYPASSYTHIVDCGTNTTFLYTTPLMSPDYVGEIGYEYCNAYLVLKYNGGTTSTVLDGIQDTIGSRGWLNQTFAISAYPNPTALEIVIETKYSWVQHTKSSQYCIDYLRIYGTVIDLENLTIIAPLDYSDPDKTFTCDIHYPIVFSIDARDYAGWNLYLEIKPISGIIIKEFQMTEHWITPQNWIFSYTFAIASTYVFLVKANDTNGYQILSEVYNVIVFDNPYPKKTSLHYYAPDGFGLDPDLFKTYQGTDEQTEIDYFYNQTHLNWNRLYGTSDVNITYDGQGLHINMSHNGLQATLRTNIVINESGFTYPFYTADTIVFECFSPDSNSLILILGGYTQDSHYYAHAKDYNVTLQPGRNTYQIPISMFTIFDDIWLLTHFAFYGTGNFTVSKIAASILFQTTFYPISAIIASGNNETQLVLNTPVSDYCSFLLIGNATPPIWVVILGFEGSTATLLFNHSTTGILEPFQLTTTGLDNLSIYAVFPLALNNMTIEIDTLAFFNETGYHLQSDANRILPPAIEFARGWETILITDYYGQQLFRNYTQWRSFIDIRLNFFVTLLYNPEDYPVNFIIQRGVINITFSVPPGGYLEIRIAASIYNVTVSTFSNTIITIFTVSLDGFRRTVITFPKSTSLTGGYQWWEFFNSIYGYFTYAMIGLVVIVFVITRRSRKSGKKNAEHDIAIFLTIYKMGIEDGNKKQSNEQIERKIRKVWVK